MLVEGGERRDERGERLPHGVGESQVGEEGRHDRDQGQARGLAGRPGAPQVDLQALHEQGPEGGQVPQDLIPLPRPVHWSVRSCRGGERGRREGGGAKHQRLESIREWRPKYGEFLHFSFC